VNVVSRPENTGKKKRTENHKESRSEKGGVPEEPWGWSTKKGVGTYRQIGTIKKITEGKKGFGGGGKILTKGDCQACLGVNKWRAAGVISGGTINVDKEGGFRSRGGEFRSENGEECIIIWGGRPLGG